MDLDIKAEMAAWKRELKAERKSDNTIKTYTTGARYFIAWCERDGRVPELDRDLVIDWMNSMHDAGNMPATVLSRQAGLRRFSSWLEEKGIIDSDPLARMKRPKLDEEPVIPLTDLELKKLFGACKGRDFTALRDKAMLHLLVEASLRAGELGDMTTGDINLDDRLAVIRRGKGGKGRIVRFSAQAAVALDDYLRARRKHARVMEPDLWLGQGQRPFSYWGIWRAVKKRGEQAGIEKLHPHQLRNTSAVRWLHKGGSPQGLMAQAGWSSIDMLRRYVKAAEQQLAAEEADRLGLGDL